MYRIGDCFFQLTKTEKVIEILKDIGRHLILESCRKKNIPKPKLQNKFFLHSDTMYTYLCYDYTDTHPDLGKTRIMSVDGYPIPRTGWDRIEGILNSEIRKRKKEEP